MITFNLKKIMDDKNISIQELSELTELSRNTISQMYNGKSKGIQFETLDKLLNSLSLSVEDILIYYPEEKMQKINIHLTEIGPLTQSHTYGNEQIFKPFPPQKENESLLQYEARIEHIEDKDFIIGETVLLTCSQKYLLKINQNEFSFSFPITVNFYVEGINDKDIVKQKFLESEYYNGEDFDKETSHAQSNYMYIKNFKKYIQRLDYNDHQIFIIKKKLSKYLLELIPEECKEFIREYDVVPSNEEPYTFID